MATIKLQNRFDQYEIAHIFTDSAGQLLDKTYKPIKSNLIWKCILGPLLAVNAYMSHWGPWPWPQNYYLIVFSIFFYYIASWIYNRLSTMPGSDSSIIGIYLVDGVKKVFLLDVSDDKQEYIVEIADGATHKVERKKSFVYYQYFTVNGTFLKEQFQKHLAGFLQNTK